jgi:hypothetical protein
VSRGKIIQVDWVDWGDWVDWVIGNWVIGNWVIGLMVGKDTGWLIGVTLYVGWVLDGFGWEGEQEAQEAQEVQENESLFLTS